MAFIPVPDGVLAEIRMLLFGQNVENTLWFRVTGGADTAALTAINNMLLTWWTSELADWMSEDVTLREIYSANMSSINGAAFTTPAPAPAPKGAIAQPSLPGNVAFCVTLRSASRGRSARGRNYVTAQAETSVVGNTLASNIRAGIIAAYNALIATADGAGTPLVVASRYANGAPRAEGVLFDVVTASSADDTVDSQRRRLNGRGS